jgi:hypothetical protein
MIVNLTEKPKGYDESWPQNFGIELMPAPKEANLASISQAQVPKKFTQLEAQPVRSIV